MTKIKSQIDIIDQETDFETIKINFHGWNEKLMMRFGWCCLSDETLVAEGWGSQKADKSPTDCIHLAEWMALKNALDFVLDRGISYKTLSIEGDSRLVINQAIGFTYLYKKKTYSETALKCLANIKHMTKNKLIIHWIPSEKNTYCALLSRRDIKNKLIKIRTRLDRSA